MTGLLDRILSKIADNDKAVAITPASGVYVKKRNGIVTVHVYVTGQSFSTSYKTLATLPVGYRPMSDVYQPAMHPDANINHSPTIAISSTNGQVLGKIASGSASITLAGTISFVTE